MTDKETTQVLALLKAAYPNSYKGMTKDEAKGTVLVWAVQFANIPGDVVMIAINKLISTSPFPPAVCEVKKKIDSLYWEAMDGLEQHKKRKHLTAEQERLFNRVLDAAIPLRRLRTLEPSLYELTAGTCPLLGNGE